ncbi:membrane protease subunit [Methylobacterium sp. E-005]|uniref:membrane protease subunit n=1 Tax=Methylobacterium sp. E-005 TaxID=2836549 RepID=UPI001FB8F893|nr:membrane protease subunit [Methylobacterium sp. E-005]MCJ2084668.1 membrane protease subunit [Methylobacterium sp. E-005]
MEGILAGVGVLVVFGVIAGGLAGCPSYNVYTQRMEGEAQLAKAESTRRTRVLEAQAEKDSAGLRADAEVIRAQGVANANKIIAESLGGPEGYLRWRYIEMLQETSGHGERSVIYLPTEAGMPILEAGKRPGAAR